MLLVLRMKTIVLQSFRQVDVPSWLTRSMESVRAWAGAHNWEYQRIGDEFFRFAPPWVRQRCDGNIYTLTDVCRLAWLRHTLADGYDRVVWADADILIFAPERLTVATRNGYAFAHELFLRVDTDGAVRPTIGINNALMVFEREQEVLDAYHAACLEVLRRLPPGPVPRTALGPTLLAALARESGLDTLAGVGLFTLAIMRQIAVGGGPLLALLAQLSPVPLGAANLCHFLRNETLLPQRPGFDALYAQGVQRLLASGGSELFPSWH